MKITKPYVIKFRVNSFEKDYINSKSKEYGLSTSEYLRRCAFNQKIRPRMTDKEFEIYSELHQFKKNFQAISNLFKTKNPGLSKEVQGLVEELGKHLEKING